MKYNELPKWAKDEVKRTYKRWALQDIEEAREAGEDVKDYTEEELEEFVMSILTSKDDFEIEYDEETDTETVVF